MYIAIKTIENYNTKQRHSGWIHRTRRSTVISETSFTRLEIGMQVSGMCSDEELHVQVPECTEDVFEIYIYICIYIDIYIHRERVFSALRYLNKIN